jgi:alpha-beta hydrolase superfamily lysophospholipase
MAAALAAVPAAVAAQDASPPLAPVSMPRPGAPAAPLGAALRSPPAARPAPPRGTLLAGPSAVPIDLITDTVYKLEPALLRNLLTRRDGLLAVTGEPRCAIAVHSMRYQTVGGQGEPADAGGVIMLPSGAGPDCSGPRPVLLYAHGTVLDKTFSMARLNGEARLIASMFAAQGYIVVAPDYAGYGGSSLPYHPYLNAEQQAADMVDALRAARHAYAALGASAAPQLFLTGYSQGGFVALATQRAIQLHHSDEFTVTATAALSGPYALVKMADDIFSGHPNTGVTSYLPLLTTSGQRAGAALYAAPEDLYEARYASGIETLLPNKVRLDDLVSKGKLPKGGALFARDSQPQAADASAFFADRNLVRTSYRNAYLQDMASNPCERDPADPLACTPQHNLRKWMQKNDLRTYAPSTPLMLCGAGKDPVVPFANAAATSAYFQARGAAPVLVDLETPLADDPYLPFKQAFARERDKLRADAVKKGNDPVKAVSDRYHSRLAAQFCLMSARSFFQSAMP